MTNFNDKANEARDKLISSATYLFVTQGIDNTTMKQIAREAGISDSIAYKYYPNKEKLITGFYELRGEQALAEYHRTEGFEEYSVAERIQLLVDTFIEQLMADREFVELSYREIVKPPYIFNSDRIGVLKDYQEALQSILNKAVSVDGYPVLPLENQISELLSLYIWSVMLFWLKDESDSFKNTTKFVELSVSLIDGILKSGSVNALIEIVKFLSKPYLMRFLGPGESLINMMRAMKSATL